MCVCLCIFRRRRRTSLVVFTDGVRIKKIYLSTELCAHLCTRIGGHTTSLLCVCVCVCGSPKSTYATFLSIYFVFFLIYSKVIITSMPLQQLSLILIIILLISILIGAEDRAEVDIRVSGACSPSESTRIQHSTDSIFISLFEQTWHRDH
jgi:energy-coupling factor transporter transmembrane protein EcfT